MSNLVDVTTHFALLCFDKTSYDDDDNDDDDAQANRLSN